MSTPQIYELVSKQILENKNLGAITENKIHQIIINTYLDRFENKNTTRRAKHPSKLTATDFNKIIEKLITAGVLKETAHNKIFFLPNYLKYNDLELILQLYPATYVSYLSAIQWYGLTNIIPKKSFITIPTRNIWKRLCIEEISSHAANEILIKNLDMYPSDSISIILDNPVQFITDSKFSELNYKSSFLNNGLHFRVKEIGQLFIDMLDKPNYCGGPQHVIDIYEEYGKLYSKQIIKAANKYASELTKARIGFILEKTLNINHPTLLEWKASILKNNVRGGSRKLFAEFDFSPYFSSEWNISINFKPLEKYGTTNATN